MTNDELLLAMSDMMDTKLAGALRPVREDIAELKTDVAELKTDVAGLKTDVAGLKTDVAVLQADVENLKTGMAKLETGVAKLENGVAKLEIGMQKLDDRVTKIELHLENVTDRNIKILAENYVPATKRFEEVTLQIPDMQCDIEVLKNVTAEHSILLGKITRPKL